MKTQNVTLAVTIDEKETVQTEYGTRYNVIIKRADKQKNGALCRLFCI